MAEKLLFNEQTVMTGGMALASILLGLRMLWDIRKHPELAHRVSGHPRVGGTHFIDGMRTFLILGALVLLWSTLTILRVIPPLK